MMNSEPSLAGRTVVVLGGSSGIGLETARRAHAQGANLILTAREPDRLHRVGLELGASISAFDLSDTDRLTRFFANLPGPVDHLLVSGAGPQYVPFAELDIGKIRQGLERIVLTVQIARLAKDVLQPHRKPAADRRHRRAAPVCGTAHLRRDRGDARAGEKPRPRARSQPRQRDRTGVRRHALSASILGRGTRCEARATPRDPADRAGRRPGGRRRPRRRPHDERRRHRGDVRHRRRPTACRALNR